LVILGIYLGRCRSGSSGSFATLLPNFIQFVRSDLTDSSSGSGSGSGSHSHSHFNYSGSAADERPGVACLAQDQC